MNSDFNSDEEEIGLSILGLDEEYTQKPLEITISREEVERHFINKEKAKELYEIMDYVDKIFSHYKIPYWLCGGSLLGACRHKGIIPWDDDLDICCFLENLDEILKLKDAFLKNNIVIDYDRSFGVVDKFFLKVYYRDHFITSNGYTHLYPFMDIFLVNHGHQILGEKEEVIHYSSRAERTLYPTYYLKTEELYPIKRVCFGPVFANIPNDSVAFLDRAYGNDWDEKCMLHNYNHLTKQFIPGPRKVFPVGPFKDFTIIPDEFIALQVSLN